MEEKMMNKSKIVAFITSLALVVLGLFMVIWPGESLDVLSKGLSYLVIAIGAVFVVMYLLAGADRAKSQWELICGVAAILLGLFVVPRLSVVLSVIPFLAGVLVVCSGIAKLFHALEYKRLGYKTWKLAMAVAVLAVVLGGAAMLYPFETVEFGVRIVGIVLLFDNFANVFDTAYIAFRLKKDGYAVVGDTSGDVIDIIQK